MIGHGKLAAARYSIVPRERVYGLYGDPLSLRLDRWFPFPFLTIDYPAPDTLVTDIIADVCRRMDIPEAVLKSRNRSAHVVAARRDIARRLYAEGVTIVEIAAALRRDRTSVWHLLGLTKRLAASTKGEGT